MINYSHTYDWLIPHPIDITSCRVQNLDNDVIFYHCFLVMRNCVANGSHFERHVIVAPPNENYTIIGQSRHISVFLFLLCFSIRCSHSTTKHLLLLYTSILNCIWRGNANVVVDRVEAKVAATTTTTPAPETAVSNRSIRLT
ncbi:hypothetical protein V1478_012063 [Vespula squamosa]|uniref:Uncharacterized protein n=1 Tax=Vespula squamosa TaxID=30214 RepID=A0ABD2AC42_VESSQ